MKRRRRLWILLSSSLAIGVGLWLVLTWFNQPAKQPPTIAGIFFPEPKTLQDFTLLDHTGRAFQRDRLQGKWTFIYFGYTSCPDACPLTLVTLNQVQQRLAQEGFDKDNAYLLISVDPERDTLERLGAYTTYFNPQFVGVTGTPEELSQLAQQCLVAYRRAPGQGSETTYSIDHSSNVILIDPQARLRAIFRPPHTPEVLVADFRKIRAYTQAHIRG